MGETQLRPDRLILGPRTLFKQWLERFFQGLPGRPRVVTHGHNGPDLPDDVFQG